MLNSKLKIKHSIHKFHLTIKSIYQCIINKLILNLQLYIFNMPQDRTNMNYLKQIIHIYLYNLYMLLLYVHKFYILINKENTLIFHLVGYQYDSIDLNINHNILQHYNTHNYDKGQYKIYNISFKQYYSILTTNYLNTYYIQFFHIHPHNLNIYQLFDHISCILPFLKCNLLNSSCISAPLSHFFQSIIHNFSLFLDNSNNFHLIIRFYYHNSCKSAYPLSIYTHYSLANFNYTSSNYQSLD